MKKTILFVLLTALLLTLSIAAADVLYLEPVEFTYVNPVYKDADFTMSVSDVSSLYEASEGTERDPDDYMKFDEAAEFFKYNMKNRMTQFVVKVKVPLVDMVVRIDGKTVIDEDAVKALAGDIRERALMHTGDPTGGDYLKYNYRQYKASLSAGASGSWLCIELSVDEFVYLDDAEQEAAVDNEIYRLKNELGLDNMTQYEKIYAIYSYITDNVVYDHVSTGILKHSSYAAIVKHKAVCQGYALFFYRLALECGVDARIVTDEAVLDSSNESHAWNIVSINGNWYNLDSTWDAGCIDHDFRWFLQNEEDFISHVRSEEFCTESFRNEFRMSENSFCWFDPERLSEVNQVTFGGHCYSLIDSDGYFLDYDAMLCASECMGGHLLTISSEEELNFILDTYMAGETNEYCLPSLTLGATDRDDEGNFRWCTGEPFVYQNWQECEPNNSSGEDFGCENYVEMNSQKGGWNDIPLVCNTLFVAETDVDYCYPVDSYIYGDSEYVVCVSDYDDNKKAEYCSSHSASPAVPSDEAEGDGIFVRDLLNRYGSSDHFIMKIPLDMTGGLTLTAENVYGEGRTSYGTIFIVDTDFSVNLTFMFDGMKSYNVIFENCSFEEGCGIIVNDTGSGSNITNNRCAINLHNVNGFDIDAAAPVWVYYSENEPADFTINGVEVTTDASKPTENGGRVGLTGRCGNEHPDEFDWWTDDHSNCDFQNKYTVLTAEVWGSGLILSGNTEMPVSLYVCGGSADVSGLTAGSIEIGRSDDYGVYILGSNNAVAYDESTFIVSAEEGAVITLENPEQYSVVELGEYKLSSHIFGGNGIYISTDSDKVGYRVYSDDVEYEFEKELITNDEHKTHLRRKGDNRWIDNNIGCITLDVMVNGVTVRFNPVRIKNERIEDSDGNVWWLENYRGNEWQITGVDVAEGKKISTVPVSFNQGAELITKICPGVINASNMSDVITIPEGIKELDWCAVGDGISQYYSVSLPASLERMNGDWAPFNCAFLSSITLATGNENFILEGSALYQKDGNFISFVANANVGCDSLTIKDGTNRIYGRILDTQVFDEVIIPSSVMEVNVSVNAKDVYLYAFSDDLYLSEDMMTPNGTLHLIPGTRAEQTAIEMGWNYFADINPGAQFETYFDEYGRQILRKIYCAKNGSAVVIPEGVEVIQSEVLHSTCDNDLSIIIPESMAEIAGDAFPEGCTMTFMGDYPLTSFEHLIYPSKYSDTYFGYRYNSKTKKAVVMSWNGVCNNNGGLIIPGTVKINSAAYNVVGIARDAVNWKHADSIGISEGIKYIESGNFRGMGASSISFPSTLEYINYYFGGMEDWMLPVTEVSGLGDYYATNTKRYCMIEDSGAIALIDTYSHTLFAYNGDNVKISFDIPEGITVIGCGAFFESVHLETVNLPDSLMYIFGGAFNGSGIKHISLPEGFQFVESYAFTHADSFDGFDYMGYRDARGFGDHDFELNDGILYVNNHYWNSDTEREEYERCLYLMPSGRTGEVFTVPDGVKGLDENCLEGCDNMKVLIIPGGIWISADSVKDCRKLESVVICGNIIEDINVKTFEGCNNLRGIRFYGDELTFLKCEWEDIKWNWDSIKATLYVRNGCNIVFYENRNGQNYTDTYSAGNNPYFNTEYVIAEDTPCGDVDDDGVITVLDTMILARALAGWTGYAPMADPFTSDMNGDGSVDAADSVILQRHIAGWEGYDSLPYQS